MQSTTAKMAVLLFALFFSPTVQGSPGPGSYDCSSNWVKIRSADDPPPPGGGWGYPEYHNSYWAYGFKTGFFQSGKSIKISGDFPHARFLSFTMYDLSNQNPIGQLQDVEIDPLPGHSNPFRIGVDRSVSERSYEAWIVAEGSEKAGASNSIVVPASVKRAAVVMRVYRADDGRDALGGAGLPRIEALDDPTDQPTGCPRRVNALWEIIKGMRSIAAIYLKYSPFENVKSVLSEDIISCRVWVAGLFPQGDNPYLAAPISREFGEVAVVRFLAPTFPRTADGGGYFTGEEEARYWSSCMCNLKTSGCSVCLSDDRMIIDEEGFVNIVVGPEEIASHARSTGWNYFVWEEDYDIPMLFFRQMKPRDDFEGSWLKIPEVSYERPLSEQVKTMEASLSVGDYAPRGHYCSKEQFLANTCDFEKEAD